MQISPATWPTVSALLDEALALPVEERDTWLQSLDGERAAFKDTLRDLLSRASGVETGDFLATLPRFTQVAPASPRGPLTELAAGESIGPYRLISELGTGGMGAVWLAERADGTLKRKVALKLPRLVWAKGLAERMARERDILATLEHPNIARLYDAGVDQHGRPYLALEYVEGQPIDVYAKERGLTVKDKLQLLLQVCGAVAYAHSRLVVHRDLKPSNILVTADGQVRLLDFGIAKLMEGDSAKETQLTELAGRALTLDYASPEQIKGEPIGTASDVYSLGVVAYELLTGAKPYRLKRGTPAELEEAIATVDATRASDATSEPAIKRLLKGDLDAILNKALKKRVGERYLTVDATAKDFERWLVGLPVQAQPDRLLYRLQKSVRRNLLAVAAASVGTAVLCAVAIVAIAQRDTARKEAARARAVQDFLLEIFRTSDGRYGDRASGQQTTARELLDRGAARLDTSLKDDPQARYELLGSMARIYSNLQAWDAARAVEERRLELAKTLLKRGDPDLVFALIAHADSLRFTPDEAKTPAFLDEAYRELEAGGLLQSELRAYWYSVAVQYWGNRSLRRAIELSDEGLEFIARAHPRTNRRVTIHFWNALLREHLAEHEAAIASAIRSVEAAQEAPARYIANWMTIPAQVTADQLHSALRLHDSELWFRANLHLNKQVEGDQSNDVIEAKAQLAHVLFERGVLDEARALQTQIDSVLASAPNWLNPSETGLTTAIAGEYWTSRGRPDLLVAAIGHETADEVRTPRGSANEYRLHSKLAEAFALLGRQQDAEQSLARARSAGASYKDGRPAPGIDAVLTATAARVALAAKQPGKALEALSSTPAATARSKLDFPLLRARAHLSLGNINEAQSALLEARQAQQSLPAQDVPLPVLAETDLLQGKALMAAGQLHESERLLREALRRRQQHDADGSIWLAEVHSALAECLRRQGKRQAASRLGH